MQIKFARTTEHYAIKSPKHFCRLIPRQKFVEGRDKYQFCRTICGARVFSSLCFNHFRTMAGLDNENFFHTQALLHVFVSKKRANSVESAQYSAQRVYYASKCRGPKMIPSSPWTRRAREA